MLLKSKIMPAVGVFLFTASTLLTGIASAKGIGSSGGGNTVFKEPGSPAILLDLFVANPQFQDNYADQKARELKVKQISSSFVDRKLPLYYVKASEQTVYPFVLNRLAVWKKTSPEVVSTIEEALNTMEFWVGEDLKPQQRYVIPQQLLSDFPRMSIETGAAFSPVLGGAMLSMKIWNQFGIYSQAGLMIHEALRQIQMVEQKYTRAEEQGQTLTDETIQRITARIMFAEPHQSEPVIEKSALGAYLKIRVGQTDSSLASRKASICRKLHDLNRVSPTTKEIEAEFCAKESNGTQPWAEGIWFSVSDNLAQIFGEIRSQSAKDKVMEMYAETRSMYYAWIAHKLDESTFAVEHLDFRLKHFYLNY